MKENSIKEDIKKLREIIEKCNKCKLNECIQCEYCWNDVKSINNILSDYKRVLGMNEILLKENKELKIRNNAIKRESEAYAENIIKLNDELNSEKDKSKYEWIRQNCLPQKLVKKLYIPIYKLKDKIKKLESEYEYLGEENKRVNKMKIELLQEIIDERDL